MRGNSFGCEQNFGPAAFAADQRHPPHSFRREAGTIMKKKEEEERKKEGREAALYTTF